MKFWKWFYKNIPNMCQFLEILMAITVFIGFLVAAWQYFVVDGLYYELLKGNITYNVFLEAVLSLVIGIEFLKMFCAPNSENVVEVLIFLVARHMIVTECTPLDMFFMVVAVCLLCIVRVYIHTLENKKKRNIQN